MTKKDIAMIAAVLHSVKPPEGERMPQWVRTVNAFTERLAQENPNFKLGQFERAAEGQTKS